MYIQCTKKLFAKLKKPYEELVYPPIRQYWREAGPITFGPISDRSKSAQIGALTRRLKDSYIGT